MPRSFGANSRVQAASWPVVTGGEPTLQPELPALLQVFKERGLAVGTWKGQRGTPPMKGSPFLFTRRIGPIDGNGSQGSRVSGGAMGGRGIGPGGEGRPAPQSGGPPTPKRVSPVAGSQGEEGTR